MFPKCVGLTEAPSGVVGSEPLKTEPYAVACMHFACHQVLAVVIRLTIHEATFDATACQPGCERRCQLAALARLDFESEGPD